MEQKERKLQEFKREISAHAVELVDIASDSSFKGAYDKTISTLSKEVTAIVDIDKSSRQDLKRRLTEDSKLWTIVASLAGSAATGLPYVVQATLAITGFASIGTSALKSSRARGDKLRESPWAFVYDLHRRTQ